MRSAALLYDIGPAVHQGAGLARYAERLAVQLQVDHRDVVQLSLLYNAHSGHALPVSLQDVPAHKIQQNQIAWRLSVLASQIARLNYRPIERIASQIDSNAPMLYHATEHLLPHLSIPTVLTVHDLIFERYPAHHTRRNMLFLRVAMPCFIHAATTIIAVSQHTKRDLIDLYAVPETKIQVVYEGIDPSFVPATTAEITRVTHALQP